MAARRQRLAEAMGIARSANVRMTVLGELVDHFRAFGHYQTAVDLIESVREQFDPAQAEELVALEEALRQEDVEAQSRESKRQAAADLARKQAQLAYYRKSLSRARAHEDQQAAALLEQAIQQLEAELAP